MAKININDGIYTNEIDTLYRAGYRFVTVVPRGENKGNIISKHRTRDAAERAARNVDRRIVDLGSLTDLR